MHPILWTLEIEPGTARAAGIVASVLLSLFIVWDGRRRPEKRASTLLQAGGFLFVSLTLSIVLLEPGRLPNPAIIAIRSYGVLTIASMLICFLIQRRLGRSIGLSEDHILSLWVYGGLLGLAGARLLHVAVNWPAYRSSPWSALAFWDGGLAYVGCVTAAMIAALLYARWHRLDAAVFDVLAVGIALSQGLGRIGCLLAGCCYGRETSLPWGVRFSEGSIAYDALAQAGAIAPGAITTPPLHPTQVYEALAVFAIGIYLLARHRHGSTSGTVACAYFVLYPIARFALELLRDDPDRQFLVRLPEETPLLLSTSQVAGIFLMALALLVSRRITARASRDLPQRA